MSREADLGFHRPQQLLLVLFDRLFCYKEVGHLAVGSWAFHLKSLSGRALLESAHLAQLPLGWT